MSVFSFFDSKEFNSWLAFTIVLSTFILWKNNKKTFVKNLILLAVSIFIASVVTQGIKYFVERPRPLSVFGVENVNIFFEEVYVRSFPSGHTTAIFANCVFMFFVVKKYWYWYVVLAFGMAFERVYVGAHFPLDILAGMAIGSLSAYMIFSFSEFIFLKSKIKK
jgi:undecaprenyl-diphosphatase